MTAPLTAPNLNTIDGIRHGFFTRAGGVSGGIFSSLNCGPGSGDDLSHVQENRKRVAHHFDLEEPRVITLHQTHSAICHTVTERWTQHHRPEGDALVSATPRHILSILTADCGPVLFADPVNHVIGAAHAGWKGAIGGVLESTLSAMEALGAKRGSTLAAIGPCIARQSYEVGQEFLDRFIHEDPAYKSYFVSADASGKYLFDLKYFIRDLLEASGVSSISILSNDTCHEEQAFFSYRRSCLRGEKGYGRQISCIALEK